MNITYNRRFRERKMVKKGAKVKWVTVKGTGKGLLLNSHNGVVLAVKGNLAVVESCGDVYCVSRRRLRGVGEPDQIDLFLAGLAGRDTISKRVGV